MAKVKDLATVLTVGLGTIAFGVTSVVIAVSVAHGMWQENRVWYRNMSKAKVGMSIQDGQPGQSVADQADFCRRAGIDPCHINYEGRMDLRKVDSAKLPRAVESYKRN